MIVPDGSTRSPEAPLTIAEREQSSHRLVDDKTFTSITEWTGRHRSTASRELGRHSGRDDYRARW